MQPEPQFLEGLHSDAETSMCVASWSLTASSHHFLHPLGSTPGSGYLAGLLGPRGSAGPSLGGGAHSCHFYSM